jgi:hypothetical protein
MWTSQCDDVMWTSQCDDNATIPKQLYTGKLCSEHLKNFRLEPYISVVERRSKNDATRTTLSERRFVDDDVVTARPLLKTRLCFRTSGKFSAAIHVCTLLFHDKCNVVVALFCLLPSTKLLMTLFICTYVLLLRALLLNTKVTRSLSYDRELQRQRCKQITTPRVA